MQLARELCANAFPDIAAYKTAWKEIVENNRTLFPKASGRAKPKPAAKPKAVAKPLAVAVEPAAKVDGDSIGNAAPDSTSSSSDSSKTSD